jgi:hypothetical protein
MTTISTTRREIVPRTKELGLRRYPFWKQILRPYFLGLCSLAIAVALWGFSYKLSRYHSHPTATQQATVAKLWGERPNATLAAMERIRNQSHLAASPQALSTSIQWSFPLDRAACWIFPEPRGGILTFDFPTPLRSPPLQN